MKVGKTWKVENLKSFHFGKNTNFRGFSLILRINYRITIELY